VTRQARSLSRLSVTSAPAGTNELSIKNRVTVSPPGGVISRTKADSRCDLPMPPTPNERIKDAEKRVRHCELVHSPAGFQDVRRGILHLVEGHGPLQRARVVHGMSSVIDRLARLSSKM
jgi:hypothetical protein